MPFNDTTVKLDFKESKIITKNVKFFLHCSIQFERKTERFRDFFLQTSEDNCNIPTNEMTLWFKTENSIYCKNKIHHG